jgi:hypothetical protein
MTFSKFDTQQQIEETPYEPTAADLEELNVWLDEVEEFQLSAPANYDGAEDSLGELETSECLYLLDGEKWERAVASLLSRD